MKKIIVIFFFMLIGNSCLVCLAQQLTKEEAKELEPSHYQTKVILTAIPAYIEMGGLNIGYGGGVDLDGFILKRFSYSAGLTFAYSDFKYTDGNDPASSDSYQGINKSGSTHANFNFHLIDKIGIGKIKVEKYKGMTTTSSGNLAHAYDMYKKRGPVRKIVAIRGGLYTWKSGVNPESDDQWFLLAKGSTTPVQATEKIFSNLTTSNFSIGISSGKVVSSVAMGAAGIVSYFRNFYVDALINTSTKMDDHQDKLKNTAAFQMDKGTLTKVPIGWRFGLKWIGTGRKYWVGGYYMEGGVRPGIEGRGPFLQMGLLLGTKYPFVPKH